MYMLEHLFKITEELATLPLGTDITLLSAEKMLENDGVQLVASVSPLTAICLI